MKKVKCLSVTWSMVIMHSSESRYTLSECKIPHSRNYQEFMFSLPKCPTIFSFNIQYMYQ